MSSQTPSPSPLSDRPITAIATGHPMLVPLTALCITGAFIGWNSLDIGSLGVLFSLGNGVVGAWGFWTVRVVLFNPMSSFRTLTTMHRCCLRVRLQSHARQGRTNIRQGFCSTIKPLRVLRKRSGRRSKKECSFALGIFLLSFYILCILWLKT
jgi:hypothetical protein